MSSQGNGSEETQPNRSEQETTEISLQFPIFREPLQYKNRLQEYTQRSSIPLPVYQTTSEGAQHAPRFRSTVLVDGSSYTSPNTFPHLKTAEQDVARVALDGISQKKDEGCPLIRKDTVFCKSILNEYAVKMNLEKPSYTTVRQEGLFPVFISSLVFNGVEYIGNAAKNKKEAEQLAARAVILSLLDHSSFATSMSEIVKSKDRFYAALHRVEDSPKSVDMPLHKVTEVEVAEGAHNIPISAVPDTCLGQLTTTSGTHSPLHEFKKPKLNPTSEPIAQFAPPIEFVSSLPQPPLVLGSTSGEKQSRKKKKSKKKLRGCLWLQCLFESISSLFDCPMCGTKF